MTTLVRWIDSGMFIYGSEWAKTDLIASAAKEWNGEVITIGRVIYEDDDAVVLGLSHDVANDTWYGAQLIHKQAITERKELG